MNDFWTGALAMYLAVLVVGVASIGGGLYVFYDEAKKARKLARILIFIPVWPVAIFFWLYLGFRYVWKIANFGRKGGAA